MTSGRRGAARQWRGWIELYIRSEKLSATAEASNPKQFVLALDFLESTRIPAEPKSLSPCLLPFPANIYAPRLKVHRIREPAVGSAGGEIIPYQSFQDSK